MFDNLKQVKQYVKQFGDENTIIFENPDYASAFVGLTSDNRAVYNFDEMVDSLIREEKMSVEDAIDFICYNESYQQEQYPVILHFADEDLIEDDIADG